LISEKEGICCTVAIAIPIVEISPSPRVRIRPSDDNNTNEKTTYQIVVLRDGYKGATNSSK
jgi:hypothetical protein